KIIEKEPQRAAHLYELFIAACHEKAEEIDDSSGNFGQENRREAETGFEEQPSSSFPIILKTAGRSPKGWSGKYTLSCCVML
ncbi:MAG: hypothetical protein WAK95_14845, partial [Desulfobacterales bacterium]